MKSMHRAYHSLWLAAVVTLSLGTKVWSQTQDSGDPFAAPAPVGVNADLVPVEALEREGELRLIQYNLMTRGDEGRFSEEVLSVRSKYILTHPKLGEKLPLLADLLIKEGNGEELANAFDAMSMRQDVPAEAIERYKAQARSIVEKVRRRVPLNDFDYDYVRGFSAVLASLPPSTENEDLLIELLLADSSRFVFKSLTRVATTRALPALEARLEQYRELAKKSGSEDSIRKTDECADLMQGLRRRLSQGTGTQAMPVHDSVEAGQAASIQSVDSCWLNSGGSGQWALIAIGSLCVLLAWRATWRK